MMLTIRLRKIGEHSIPRTNGQMDAFVEPAHLSPGCSTKRSLIPFANTHTLSNFLNGRGFESV